MLQAAKTGWIDVRLALLSKQVVALMCTLNVSEMAKNVFASKRYQQKFYTDCNYCLQHKTSYI